MRQALWPLLGFLVGAIIGFSLFHAFSAYEEAPVCLEGSVDTVFSPGAEEEIIGLIRGAEESVDVEIYLFNYEPLADELIKAGERGVRVRVILEPRLSGENPNLEMMEYLRNGGIEARWASLEYKLTHTKTMVIDKKRVLVGSTNWSYSALNKNREHSVLIEDEGVARRFSDGFEEDWAKAGALADWD